MTAPSTEATVGQLVAQRPARARLFERLGIDYCCGGRLSLADACAKRGLDPARVADEIRADDDRAAPPERDWTAATAAELADHIEAAHHARMRAELPRLAAMTARVAEAHGARRRGVIELRNVFQKFASELTAHMLKEERVLFPWIRALESGAEGAPTEIGDPVVRMMQEHDTAGEDLAAMRALTDGYTPPIDACGTHRAMLDGLRELEADMHQHVHKENNILFPKALELARARSGGASGACCCTRGQACGG